MKYVHVGGSGYGDILLAVGGELVKGNYNANINFVHGRKFKEEISANNRMSFSEIFKETKSLIKDAENMTFSYTYDIAKDYSKYGINPSLSLEEDHHGFMKDLWVGGDYIALCIADQRTVNVNKVNRSYKDIPNKTIIDFAYEISRIHSCEVRLVSHANTPSEILEIVTNSKMCVTYDGGISWIANWSNTPTIVVSGNVDKSSLRNNNLIYNIDHRRIPTTRGEIHNVCEKALMLSKQRTRRVELVDY